MNGFYIKLLKLDKYVDDLILACLIIFFIFWSKSSLSVPPPLCHDLLQLPDLEAPEDRSIIVE